MKYRNLTSRFVSFLLAVVMVFAMIPQMAVHVHAEEDEGGTETPEIPYDQLSTVWPSVNTDLTHIICYGQSFSTGSDAPYYADPEVDGVYVYGSITNSANGTALTGLTGSTKNQHPIISAGNVLAQMLNGAGYDTDIVLGSYGAGGRTIAQLMSPQRQQEIKEEDGYTYDIQSSGRYEVFQDSVAAIARYAEKSGQSVGCPVIVYLQGETDQNTDAQLGYPENPSRAGYGAGGDKEKYKEYMSRLKEDMQREVMERYGQTEKPLFMIYQVSGTYTRTQYSSINMAQIEFAQENGDVILVQTPYFTSHYTNSHHLTQNGYRWLGEYIGRYIYAALVEREKTWPMLPDSIEIVDENTVRVTISGAEGGLAIDTWTVEDATNSKNRYGFYLQVDNTNVAPVDVTVSENCIELTLPERADLYRSENVYLYYAGKNASGTGNIRDNCSELGFYEYLDDSNDTGTGNNQGVSHSSVDADGNSIIGRKYPMYNWLASFCYKLEVPEGMEREVAYYHWEMQESNLVSVTEENATENALTLLEGTVDDGVLNKARYSMEKTIVLEHDRPWVIEWNAASGGSGYAGGKFLVASGGNGSCAQYLYLPADTRGMVAWGVSSDSANYGFHLNKFGIDTREEHTYRIENRIDDDGVNTVYLIVDDAEIGPMNTGYRTSSNASGSAGSLIEEPNNWANGKNLYLDGLGDSGSFLLNNMKLSYLKIWEDGVPHTHTYKNGICSACGSSVLDGNYTHAIPENQGVQNAIDRAYSLTDVEWTPLADVPGVKKINGEFTVVPFEAGVTYRGIPYSGVTANDCYVGLNVSLESFLTALENENSVLYTENLFSTNPKSATYFGTVCSKFAQYALDVPGSYNTNNVANIPGMETIAMPGEYTVDQIKLGDVVLHTQNHTTVCTDILYDADGNVAFIEISEAVLPLCRRLYWSPEEFYEHFEGYRLCRYQYIGQTPAIDETELAADYALMPRFGDKYNYKVSSTKGVVDVLESGYSKAVILRDGAVINEIILNGASTFSFDRSVPGHIEMYLVKEDGTRSDSVYAWVVESSVAVKDASQFTDGKLTVTIDGSCGTPVYVQVGSAHAIFCNVEGKDGTVNISFPFSKVSSQQVRVAYQNEYGIYLSSWVSFTTAENPSSDPLLSQAQYWDGYTLTPSSHRPTVQSGKTGYWTYTMVPVEENTTYYSKGCNRMWFLDEQGNPISTFNANTESDVRFQFTTPVGTVYVSITYAPSGVDKGTETLVHVHTYEDGICIECGHRIGPVITKQPTDGKAKMGEPFCVTVEAEGEGLKYQWYVKEFGTTTWIKSSITDNTYDSVMNAQRAGRQIYCVITDANGNSVTTNTVKLVLLPTYIWDQWTQPVTMAAGTHPTYGGSTTGYYSKGQTFGGILYSSTIRDGRDVLWNLNPSTYYSAVANPASLLYTTDYRGRVFNESAWAGSVCNTTAMKACGYAYPYTTTEIPLKFDEKADHGIDNLEFGDILWTKGHVAGIIGVTVGDDGHVASVKIIEQASYVRVFEIAAPNWDAYFSGHWTHIYRGDFDEAKTAPEEYPENLSIIFERGNNTYVTDYETMLFYIPTATTVYVTKNGVTTSYAKDSFPTQMVNGVTVYDLASLFTGIGDYYFHTEENTTDICIKVIDKGRITISGTTATLSGYENCEILGYRVIKILDAAKSSAFNFFEAPEGYTSEAVNLSFCWYDGDTFEIGNIPADTAGWKLEVYYDTGYGWARSLSCNVLHASGVEHSYEATITAPTCTEQGYTTYTCTTCGDSYVDDYVEALGHTYSNSFCTACGRQKNTTATPLDKGITVTATPENYLTISNPATEKLACGPGLVTYGDGEMAVVYLADDINAMETESSATIVCRLGLFNLDSPQNGTFLDIAAAGQTIGNVTIGQKAPYEPNLLVLEDGKLLVLFNIRDTSGKYIYYSATVDPESKAVTDYTPLTLDGKNWVPTNIAASYNAIADNSISLSGPAGSMVFTSRIVNYGGYYYGYCGGICSGFGGILVRSTDGINWTSVMAPEALPEMAGVIECGFQFVGDYIYFCMRDISSGVYQCSYNFTTGEQLVSTHKLPNLTTSKPTTFTQEGKLYLIANKATGDDATVGRRNTALFYEVDPAACRLTLIRQIFCADGCAYHSVVDVNGINYWAFHTDARRINPYTQGRSNIAFLEIPALCSHTYESMVTDPSCTEQGYTTYICTSCGDSYVDDYVEAVGHRYESNTCIGCGKVRSGILNLADYSHMYASGCITVAANVWQSGAVNYHYQIPLSDFADYNQVTVTANSTNKSYIAFFTKRMTEAGAIAYADGWTEVLIMDPGTTQTLSIPADAKYMYILNNNAAGDSLLPDSVVFSCRHTYSNGLCTTCGHDCVEVTVDNGTLSVTCDELEPDTLIWLVSYDGNGKFVDMKRVTLGEALTLPAGERYMLLFVNDNWIPLRKQLDI